MISDSLPRKLTSTEACGMTVNERLWHAGLLEGFDKAVANRDTDGLRKILGEVYLDESAVEAIIVQLLGRN